MAEITRESPVSPVKVLPLDDSLFRPTGTELDFLKATVDQDENRLKERVLKVQQRAYEEYPYPSIWAFHFVDLLMSQHPFYPSVLAEAKASLKDQKLIFLDLGCCMGTDVRKLALDGYPASNIVGCDVRSTYIDLGHELYQDSPETCPIHFITSDIFDIPLNTVEVDHDVDLSELTTLSQLIGRIKYLYVGSVFHLFDESTQLAIAQRLARLVSREDGVVIFGRHEGLETPSLVGDNVWRKRFVHSPNSWKKMWQDILIETDGEVYTRTRVTMKAELSRPNILKNLPGPYRQLIWSVHLGGYAEPITN